VAAGQPDVAARHWQEAVRQAPPAGSALTPLDVAECGAWVLKAAAERGQAGVYRDVRAALLPLLGGLKDEAERGQVGRQLVLADAWAGHWDEALERAGPAPDRAVAQALAVIRARQGSLAEARNLLADAAGDAARPCWHIAFAQARADPARTADLLGWLQALPDPAGRCGAALGVAAGLSAGAGPAPRAGEEAVSP
jgi:hypothetical protein